MAPSRTTRTSFSERPRYFYSVRLLTSLPRSRDRHSSNAPRTSAINSIPTQHPFEMRYRGHSSEPSELCYFSDDFRHCNHATVNHGLNALISIERLRGERSSQEINIHPGKESRSAPDRCRRRRRRRRSLLFLPSREKTGGPILRILTIIKEDLFPTRSTNYYTQDPTSSRR